MNNVNFIPIEIYRSMALPGLSLLLLPLISFILIYSLPGKSDSLAGWTGTVIIGLTLLAAIILFPMVWNQGIFHSSVPWLTIHAGDKEMVFRLGLVLDNISVLIALAVLIISFAAHLYSIDFMKGEQHIRRYFAFLGFFTFSMLGIVLSDNLLMIFIFWELVGFSSYILIGFWFHKPSAAYAARKTYIVNRVADMGFLIALMILWSKYGTFDLRELTKNVSELYSSSSTGNAGQDWLVLAGLGLFLAAMGKSAQFPLMVWLPDAMEGPIPVSALIHAATMVAAGVFLMFRSFGILAFPVLNVIAVTGTLTALLSALSALTQNDLKKVLAYSTISQLGFMMMGIGTGGREPAIFHLVTHAFFKAGLFLSAGMVVKSLSQTLSKIPESPERFNAQDMRIMGGLRKILPLPFVAFTACAAGLAGIPFFSGFLSKDTILERAVTWANLQSSVGEPLAWLIPAAGFITSLLTVIYISRAVILVFFGELRLPSIFPSIPGLTGTIKNRPMIAGFPVIMLALFSLGMVYSLNPFDAGKSWIFQNLGRDISGFYSTASFNLIRIMTEIPFRVQNIIMITTILIAITGITLAYYLYPERKPAPGKFSPAAEPAGFFNRWPVHNWYLDNLFHYAITRPVTSLSNLAAWFDRKIIDGIIDFTGVTIVVSGQVAGWFDRVVISGIGDLAAWVVRQSGNLARSVQSGRVQAYYIWTITVVILIFIWLIL